MSQFPPSMRLKGSTRGKALVIGADSRAFLAVCRSLGRQGIEVHAIQQPPASKKQIAFFSKYIVHERKLPPLEQGVAIWQEALHQCVLNGDYDLVIPCPDEAVLAMMQVRDKFQNITHLAIPNKTSELLFNKLQTTALARSLGVSVQDEQRVGPSDTAEKLSQKFGLPLVLKPVSSVSIRELGRRRKVSIAHTIPEVKQGVELGLRAGGVIAQRYFQGTGLGVEVLCSNGSIQFAFQHERINEPLGGGGSSYRESSEILPELLEAVQKLTDSVEYNGLAMFEFIRDKKTGNWVFLECNARVWGSLPLALEAGADFPYLLWRQAVVGDSNFSRDYSLGVRSYNLTKEVARTQEKNGRLHPFRGQLHGLTHIIKMLTLSSIRKVRNDCLVIDDPIPGIFELVSLVTQPFRGSGLLLKKLWLASENAFRYRKSRRTLRKSLGGAKKILFVCKGNICRSPFAELYFRISSQGEYDIASAGYYPAEGRESPEYAVESASSRGVDMGQHRSRILTQEMISWADLVFVFDGENWEHAVRRFPSSVGKMVLLGSVSGPKEVYISDPFGGDLSTFDDSYLKIQRAIDSLLGFSPGRPKMDASTE